MCNQVERDAVDAVLDAWSALPGNKNVMPLCQALAHLMAVVRPGPTPEPKVAVIQLVAAKGEALPDGWIGYQCMNCGAVLLGHIPGLNPPTDEPCPNCRRMLDWDSLKEFLLTMPKKENSNEKENPEASN